MSLDVFFVSPRVQTLDRTSLPHATWRVHLMRRLVWQVQVVLVDVTILHVSGVSNGLSKEMVPWRFFWKERMICFLLQFEGSELFPHQHCLLSSSHSRLQQQEVKASPIAGLCFSFPHASPSLPIIVRPFLRKKTSNILQRGYITHHI